jgi:hypothetical protein
VYMLGDNIEGCGSVKPSNGKTVFPVVKPYGGGEVWFSLTSGNTLFESYYLMS